MSSFSARSGWAGKILTDFTFGGKFFLENKTALYKAALLGPRVTQVPVVPCAVFLLACLVVAHTEYWLASSALEHQETTEADRTRIILRTYLPRLPALQVRAGIDPPAREENGQNEKDTNHGRADGEVLVQRDSVQKSQREHHCRACQHEASGEPEGSHVTSHSSDLSLLGHGSSNRG